MPELGGLSAGHDSRARRVEGAGAAAGQLLEGQLVHRSAIIAHSAWLSSLRLKKRLPSVEALRR